MSQAQQARLRETVLHDWHAGHGARMVEFGGWHMPVQYPDGIIREHLATRRHAGLFDVSHMGRFRVRGPAAQQFLLRVLSNDARRLAPGRAQYTLIATPTGGAVDDAYLYMLEAGDYLLVVNASNREKDLAWISDYLPAGGVELRDESEDVAMISLQGPESQALLGRIVAAGELPEPGRNRLRMARIEGREVMVARTGYTGESMCFELFPPRELALPLWERLVELGAVPVGLGARDSLRLEAGLPLYGHELGTDPEGREIPVFAISLARFAVRAADSGDYVGRKALERQRRAWRRIRRGEARAADREVLPRMVQPVAVFRGRRPLRAGFRVLSDGREAGWITSGTTIPYARPKGAGGAAASGEGHELRPIGLAMLDSDIRYRPDRPVALEVADERGNRMQAELVEGNLQPPARAARSASGASQAPAEARFDAAGAGDRARALAAAAARNTRWRRRECINLIPSEQTPSKLVEKLCISDPEGRYNEHNRLRSLGPGAPEVRYYKGTAFMMEKEEECKAALRTFFGCIRVEPRVISGQMANDTVYDALKQFRSRLRGGGEPQPLRRVLVHDLNRGGHLSAQFMGALRNYVAPDPDTGRPAVEHFPIQPDNPHRIDVEKTKRVIGETRPELIVFGRSVIIHREPVREIAEFVHREWGRDDPRRPLILYDGAHVLGLLGKHYQDPLAEGADVVTGSTHKSFFGPQRGVILSNIEPGSAFDPLWSWIERRAFPGHVSNHHLGTLLGLLGATCEMLRYRDEYPPQVIANAKAYARALAGEGLALEGEPGCDFTETHQVLLRGARAQGVRLADLLEENNVITNPQAYHDDPGFAAASGVRMGTQEMTRYGMKEDDFRHLAALVAEILREGRGRRSGFWRSKVKALRRDFTRMRYCL